MPENRRTPSRGSGPRGRTGPGRGGAPRSTARPAAGATPRASSRRRRPPRLTGRAAVLVLVLVLLAVSYASSARAYLQQRGELEALRADIAEKESSISDLEREMRRWEDPAYVTQEARELGYVMPGETSYVVLDENGDPLEPAAELPDPEEVGPEVEPAFWEAAWGSVLLAGNPPRNTGTPPLTEIDGSEEQE
ncbi:Cell division protein FtsL [Nocardioides dokdonensis FR1436]|uniref:Cell division protein FtsL n=1 Tax=Nocardioides dokdonensis FR1436 TaxID=1300347 RepID=A0A1A9GK01_9ACTN|nr:septum formation initiator family protein [Nocardioides dokdonensis]ANH38406.1 Cell division protein FtsL [Nocardioides dokdonensis FR1436]